ncbi:MAG TPA: dihydrofolate reductase [Rhizomicrobium sp.]|nr:dihydrofolate reductase [Rhizomicrobium sp.]
MTITSLVVARADNGVIGKNGALPWRIPEDMRHFKALTIGKPCIMGRKTWDSLPKKPLPERDNIVVTRDAGFNAEGAAVFHTLEDAFARACGASEICVIGGAELYKATLPFATRIYLTEVHGQFEGDTTLPPFDTSIWVEISREDQSTADGLRYSYVTLERRA